MAKDIEFFKAVEMLEAELDFQRSLMDFSEFNACHIAGLEKAYKILTKKRKCKCTIALKMVCEKCHEEKNEGYD